jgi:hypothetical protein
MEVNDPKIKVLREMVSAAREKFDMAIGFHEVWKPAVYGQKLLIDVNEIYLLALEHLRGGRI